MLQRSNCKKKRKVFLKKQKIKTEKLAEEWK